MDLFEDKINIKYVSKQRFSLRNVPVTPIILNVFVPIWICLCSKFHTFVLHSYVIKCLYFKISNSFTNLTRLMVSQFTYIFYYLREKLVTYKDINTVILLNLDYVIFIV